MVSPGRPGAALLPPAAVVLVALACLSPLAWRGFPWNTDDVHYHAMYAGQFLREMLAGAPYPRWLTGMNNGLGAPIFFFYGPIPYWITGAAGLLTGERDGFALVELAVCLVLVASGLSAYLWLRSLVAAWPAAWGAAVYVALPYHLTVDLWTRAAFAEFTGYLWTPLLFLGIERIRRRGAGGVPLLAASFALLIATHIITAMLMACLAGLYALLRLRSARTFVWAAGGFGLAVALAAGYLAPALGLRDAVFVPVSGLPRSVFLLSGEIPAGRAGLWQALDALLVAELALAAVLLAASFGLLAGERRRLALAWSTVLFAALVMTTGLAAPVWRALPVLQNAQYPFRLNTGADLALATLSGLLAGYAWDRFTRPGWLLAAGFAGAAAVGVAQVALPIGHGNFDRAGARWGPIVAVQGDSAMFRPRASLGKLPVDASPPRSELAERVQVVAGQAHTRLDGEGPRRMAVHVDADGPATLRLGQLFFPGWQVVSAGQSSEARPSAGEGLVEFDVPPGAHDIVAELAPGALERAGDAVSAAACVVWTIAAVLALFRRRGRADV